MIALEENVTINARVSQWTDQGKETVAENADELA